MPGNLLQPGLKGRAHEKGKEAEIFHDEKGA
jgi:hypothetical protein